jgi:hypothetical protein
MRVIIAGSRGIPKQQTFLAIRKCPWSGFISCVISGTCRGPDQDGEIWAKDNGIEIERHPADWDTFGKAAGHIRNEEMARVAHGLIAVWDGKSNGTKDIIQIAERRDLQVCVFYAAKGKSINYPPSGDMFDLWQLVEERAAIMEYMGGMSRKEAEKLAGMNWNKGPAL